MSAAPTSIDQALDWLRARFRPKAAGGASVLYRVVLTGEGGGVLSAHVHDGALQVCGESLPDPDVIFELAARDFFAVLGGVANPDLLFMAEQLRVEGDLQLALKLRSFFEIRRSAGAG